MNYMAEANTVADQLRGVHIPRKTGGRRRRETLSAKQIEILAFMREYFAENDQLPSVSTTAQKFNMNNAGADWHIGALIRLNRLERNAVGKLRFARPKGGAQ